MPEGAQESHAATAAPRPRFSFRAKLSLAAGLLALIPLVVVGVVVIDINATAVKTIHRELQLAALEDIARTIDGDFGAAENGLDAVGRALTNTRLTEEARLSLATTLVGANESLDHAAIYTEAGRHVDTIRVPRAKDVKVPPQLDETLREHAAAENVAVGEATIQGGEPRVLVALPIRAGTRVTGYVAAQVSLAGIQARVERLAAAHFSDRIDSLFVVDERLRLLAHPDAERSRGLASARGAGVLQGVDVRTLTPSVARSGEYRGADGVPMVGSLIGLQKRPWAVAVQVPRRVAYASLYAMRRAVIWVVAASIALALVTGLLLARRIAAPLRRLTEFAGDLAARRFDRRVAVGTSDELSVLAAAMSNAAADLEASEERIHREVAIRTDLGRYLPASLVEKVVRREQDMGLGGRRCPITVLFADVVAFTPLAEKLGAELVVAVLNELFTILTEIVFRHGGTVDKFMGDCLMAFFGAPSPQEDHAARALRTVTDMVRWLEVGNARWQQQHGLELKLAIGVNSGEAVVGNLGSEARMEYTAIGDVVNVAARLEAVARPQQIVVSRATRDLAGEGFEYVDLGPRALAGRAEPVYLYEVVV